MAESSALFYLLNGLVQVDFNTHQADHIRNFLGYTYNKFVLKLQSNHVHTRVHEMCDLNNFNKGADKDRKSIE